MLKKYIILLKESQKSRIISGLLLGLVAFVLCICIALIAIVYSPSVYQAAYRKGCIDSAYDVDSDNFDKYYTVLTNFLSSNDETVLENSQFKANDKMQNMFTQSDIELLKQAGNMFVLVRVLAVLAAASLATSFVILGLKRGKRAVSQTACWSFVSYLILLLGIYIFVGASALTGISTVDALYNVLTFGAISAYGGGNLALFYGKVTMQSFASSLFTMITVFGVILLVILVALCRAVYKKHRDENEDFLYQ